ncbi:hypothetical protein ACHQM5_024966 [Ranunculus cassubicifolius]
MVAATLSDTRPHERDNGGRRGEEEEGIDSLIITSRKPKSRQVTSRYLSSPSPSPSPSPSTSTSTTTTTSSSSSSSSNFSRRSGNTLASPAIKRTQSVERRRSATPRPAINFEQSRLNGSNVGDAGSVSVASKVLITSTRSLAVSFQGESFSLPISKTKAVPPTQSFSYVRKSTPERRRDTPLRGGDQLENSRPSGGGDQQRWPGRSRVPNSLSRSLDCTGEKKNGSGNVVRVLEKSMMTDEVARVSFDGKLNLMRSIQFPIDTDSIDGSVASSVTSDLVPSDAESISSCANSGSLESGGGEFARMRNVPPPPRGISVPARFWQETNSKLRRLQEPGTPLNGSLMVPPRIISSKRVSVDSPGPSPRTLSRGMSPLRGPVRPVSPSKLMVSSASTPSRGMPSPSRTRNATGGLPVVGQLNNMPSILSFATRGKMGENKIEDAHLSRLLYNRLLQWRFVNARADAAMLVQRLTVEKNLYDAWKSVSELRKSVTLKRMKLQFIRHDLKLTSILRGQMICLEECSLLDREHSSSLSGAIKALEASTLRLPVVGGARADVENIKDAVSSAVDVMQAMASSICSSLPKVEEMNILAAQLVNMTRQERALLDQCRHLMSILAAMQIKDSSLRAQILQIKRLPTILTTQV